MAEQKLLVVAGGGAGGFFCAVNAARVSPLLKVLLVEKSSKFLSKVKISGGGRCNVTHNCFDIQELVKKYPRGKNFLKKSFHWFSAINTTKWFSERGIALKTEEDGRMFPVTDQSQTIINCLFDEAKKYEVELRPQTGLLSFEKKGDQFLLSLSNGKVITADFLCIATGGFPKPDQFQWLMNTGHTIESPVPSLFSFNILDKELQRLSGISVENVAVRIKDEKLAATGPLLVTHWGFSGPAILKLSAFGARILAEKNYSFEIVINWVNGVGLDEQKLQAEWMNIRNANASRSISSKNPFQLPARLWEYLLRKVAIDPKKRWADINHMEKQKLVSMLTTAYFRVDGKTTFKEEFVTAGGIKLNEINPNTMESKLMKNLFFAGEIMDVDGITGGFNFQHAWTSGWIAAKAIAEKG